MPTKIYMEDDKIISKIISSMNSTKYDIKILTGYAATLLKKNNLIEQGLIQKREYVLKSAEQIHKLVDILSINKKPSIIF